MKTYAIVLIACGSLIAALIILFCLCSGGGKKKKQSRSTPNPIAMRTVTAPPAQWPFPADLERGEARETRSGTNDGGMVILAGAGAALATAAVVDGITSSGCGGCGMDGGGGHSGGCGNGGGGGACGGGCGGCGGGCGC